jgi:hypothetical protein
LQLVCVSIFHICFHIPFELTKEADDIPNKATTPPLPNVTDVSNTFLVNLVQALDHDIPYIQMPCARPGDLLTSAPKSASSKALLPGMTTLYDRLNRCEEDYVGSEYHDFTYQDSEWYQRAGSEFEYLTNAMLIEHLRIGSALEGVISGRIRKLIEVVLDFSENITRWRYGTPYEALSGLRYWEMNADGSRSLFKEWVELLTKTKYLKWTPPEVQGFFNALSDRQKRKAAGLSNLRNRKFYGRLAIPNQHNSPLTINPSIPSPPRSSRKRKDISDNREDGIDLNKERIKRQAGTRLKTRFFAGVYPTEKSQQSVQPNVFTNLIDPEILASTSTGSLSSASFRQTSVSVPAFAFQPQSIIPTIPISQPPNLGVPTPMAQVATQHQGNQGTAVVFSQPILPAASPVPVYAPTLTLKSAGIERYPWTQVRQQMWMRKNSKTVADLPAEAFRATYNPAHTGTPENANPRLLGHMHVTICEVLTYFPLSPTIREIAYRLAQAHWEASDIIKYIFWTRNITDNMAIKRSTVHRMLASGKKWANGKTVQATAELDGLDLASGLTGFGAELIDVPLFFLADNVANHPTGQDAGILTQCIARCRNTADQNIMMADAETYARLHGISDHYAHMRNGNVMTEDEEALGRVGQISTAWFRAASLRLK